MHEISIQLNVIWQQDVKEQQQRCVYLKRTNKQKKCQSRKNFTDRKYIGKFRTWRKILRRDLLKGAGFLLSQLNVLKSIVALAGSWY